MQENLSNLGHDIPSGKLEENRELCCPDFFTAVLKVLDDAIEKPERCGNSFELKLLDEMKDCRVQICNLDKQVKDHARGLKDHRELKEAELQDAKLKLQEIEAESQAKLYKEREDSLHKLEEMKLRYEDTIREFKEPINVEQTVLLDTRMPSCKTTVS